MTQEKPQPERNEGEEENQEMDFQKPDFTFIPKGNHEYRQSGYYLICFSCDLKHGVFIGKDKLLTGFKDNGEPILRTRKELGMA